MALIHDIAEARVSDHSYVQKCYVQSDEERAAHDALDGTAFSDFEDILREFETRESMEAKILKDADNLDVDIELHELEERGQKLPQKWISIRKGLRDNKYYTQVAKDFWDELQNSDPASWHLKMNKYACIPDAGR